MEAQRGRIWRRHGVTRAPLSDGRRLRTFGRAGRAQQSVGTTMSEWEALVLRTWLPRRPTGYRTLRRRARRLHSPRRGNVSLVKRGASRLANRDAHLIGLAASGLEKQHSADEGRVRLPPCHRLCRRLHTRLLDNQATSAAMDETKKQSLVHGSRRENVLCQSKRSSRISCVQRDFHSPLQRAAPSSRDIMRAHPGEHQQRLRACLWSLLVGESAIGRRRHQLRCLSSSSSAPADGRGASKT